MAMVFSLFAPCVAPLVLVGSAILIGVGRGFLGRFSCSAACRLACGVFLVVLVLSFRLVVLSCRFVLLFFFSFVGSGVGALCCWFVSESRREGSEKVAGGGPAPWFHALCDLSPRAGWIL